jgi:methylenetetrahydrofolate dehydrogenase (NADP+)/methenyltetrahydrofolate cyclohydrolase
MSAIILDGRTLSRTLRDELQADIQQWLSETNITPTLAVVQVLGDPSAERYVRAIRKSCEGVGIACNAHILPAEVTQEDLEAQIEALSNDASVHGIILQMPLPGHFDSQRVIDKIDPRKDVDGVHPTSAGRLAQGLSCFVPNTPAGGIELLRRNNIAISGKNAVVVGRSSIVGKPMAMLLLAENATVTIAHSRTPDLGAVIRNADIVAAAVGRAGLITGDMLKPGAAVVDFGINVLEDGSLVGDVEYASAAEVAGAITPVPGGTGPMTNVMLMRNVLRAAREQQA